MDCQGIRCRQGNRLTHPVLLIAAGSWQIRLELFWQAGHAKKVHYNIEDVNLLAFSLNAGKAIRSQ